MSGTPTDNLPRPLVLVTGGASGIGLATARAVLARGWRVAIADARHDNLDRARETLDTSSGAVFFERLDVTDEEAVARLVSRYDAEIGPLSGLVNSAGIASDVGCLETSTALFRQILEVNLLGSFTVAREAARSMLRRGRGSIVNIASVSGVRGNAGRVAYGASKAGLISMTQVMAAELGSQGVRVNAVAPGAVESPLTRELHTDQFRSGWARQTPQRRYGTAEEIAAAVLFLLDDRQSGFITGQTLCVDGGFTTAGLLRDEG